MVKRREHAVEELEEVEDDELTPLTEAESRSIHRTIHLAIACGLIEVHERDDYSPTVPSLVALARFFDVNERTVARWKSEGMPVWSDGHISLLAALLWRRSRPNPEDWHETGNRKLLPSRATGD